MHLLCSECNYSLLKIHSSGTVFVCFTCMVRLCQSQSKTSKKLMDFCAKAPVLVSVPLIYLTFMTCASMQIKVCSVKFYVISTMCCTTFILSLPPRMVTLSGVRRNTVPTTPTVPACIYGTHTMHGNLTLAQTYAVGRALPAIVISVLTEIISPSKTV